MHLWKSFLLSGLLFFGSLNSSAENYKIAYSLDKQNPPGNIAVSKHGRIFMSNHFFYDPQYRIVEINQDGSATPYPNITLSQSLNPVLGVIVDSKNILWMLETASGKDRAGRLIGWDIGKQALYRMIYLSPPVIPENSFLNDLAVDRKNQAIYITDTAGEHNSALIVVDLKTGETRRVLHGSSFTVPEKIEMQIDGNTVTVNGKPARIGVNPITIDHQGKWVYFAPMTGTTLYRVKTKDLLNKSLSDTQLQKRIEAYAPKPISDGITIDNDNNIYITDITANAVGYIDKKRKYHVLFQDDEKFSWADGFSTGPDNEIFLTVNKLHKSPPLNNGQNDSGGKYYILKFKPLGKTTIGR